MKMDCSGQLGVLKRQVKQVFQKGIPKLPDEISEIAKSIKDEYLIDKGSYGEVHGPFIWRKNQCAVKRITYSISLSHTDLDDEMGRKKKMWTHLSHENLIQILDVYLNRQTVYIMMEYAEGGSLRKTLDTYAPKLPNEVVWNWTKQIADGMFYLHSSDIVHRDLKSSNVLLSKPFDISDSNAHITLKIADFDEMREHQGTLTMTFIGTLGWMAPEVLLNGHFSKSSDVWSYGVVVWEMVKGEIPQKGVSLEELVSKAKSRTLALPLPKAIPARFFRLLNYCFGVESDDPPSFQCIMDLIEPPNYNTYPVVVTTIGKSSAGQVNLVAISDEELFLANCMSPVIEVYNLVDFTMKHSFEVENLVSSWDMAYCCTLQILYIMDNKQRSVKCKEIYRVHAYGGVIGVWQTKGDYGQISVTPESNIILTCTISNRIEEYTSDGEIVQEIEFSHPAGSAILRHTIKLGSTPDQYLVSHGLLRNERRGIFLINANGDNLKSFDGDVGSSAYRLFLPIQLATDSFGSIFVLDQENSRILLLSSDLKFKQEIILKVSHCLIWPNSMAFDERRGRLCVTHKDWNRSEDCVFVFKVLQ